MDLLRGFHRFSEVLSILIDFHTFHRFFIDLHRFALLFICFIACIDFNGYAWFLMDLQRFSKSKMLAKLIKHSFWGPSPPCTFRVVRFELTRFANAAAAWI